MTQRRNLSRRAQLASLVVAYASIAAIPARASTFGAAELTYDTALLGQFNLIDLGNFAATSSQSIGGRAIIGGNVALGGGTTLTACGSTSPACNSNSSLGVASTSSNVVTATSSSSNNGSTNPNYGYGALTVFGSITNSNSATGAIGVSAPNGGDIDVGGAITARNSTNTNGNITINNGGINIAGAVPASTVGITGSFSEIRATSAANVAAGTNIQNNDTIAQVFAPFANGSFVTNNLAGPLTDLSRGIANLPGTPQALPSNTNVLLTANADYTYGSGKNADGRNKTYGIVTTTADNLASAKSGAGISNGSTNEATFVIVTGQLSSGNLLPVLSGGDSRIIYDFVDATSLSFAGQWNASILAPLATITSQAGAINGTVVVAAMNQSQALNVGNAFNVDLSGLSASSFRRVPEPASLALIGVGLAAAAAVRRRRR